jgi:hypothetical protein
MRYQKYILMLIIALGGAAVARPARAQAQPGVPTCGAATAVEDRDGDGSADFAALDCDFGTGEMVRLSLFCPGGGLDGAALAGRLLNPGPCAWVFDSGADGAANLIVRFHEADGSFFADLYDDRDGDGQVAHAVAGSQVSVAESEFWTVRLISDGPWHAGDDFNFNLTLIVDGDVEAQFGASVYQSIIANDGLVDFTIEVVDETRNGRPDYEIRRLLIPRYLQRVGQVFQLMVNWRDTEPPPENAALWPYLSAAAKNAGSRVPKPGPGYVPPIQVDWATGKIVAISEFVASRGGESNCFIYGSDVLEKGLPVAPGFENPFCFYDLAADGDGSAELSIRSEYWPAHFWAFVGGLFDGPMQWIRYSWDRDNDGAWDYGVGVSGRHEYDATVSFGEYLIRSVPYDEFPTWVAGREWDEAVFVESVDRKYFSSEGIYEAQVPLEVIQGYLTGLIKNRPPVDLESFIYDGLRIEYAPDLTAQARLYYSPVDARLHLSGATTGLWEIGDGAQIRYANTDGDPFIDEWRYMEGEALRGQLNRTPDYLALADAAGQSVALKEATTAPAVFEVGLPTDNAGWTALGRMLEDNAGGELTALEDMMAQFDGPETRVSGATLADFRQTAAGFRFRLTLAPGYGVNGPDLLGLAGLAPGEYLVENRRGAFSVAPLASAQPALEVRQPDPNAPARVAIANSGGTDLLDLELVVEATTADGTVVELLRQPAEALAGETAGALVDIPTALAAGSPIVARLEDAGGRTVVQSASMPAPGAPPADRAAVFTLERAPVLVPVVSLFGIILVLAALLAATRRPEENL